MFKKSLISEKLAEPYAIKNVIIWLKKGNMFNSQDPNLRIIRELRQEITQLKIILGHNGIDVSNLCYHSNVIIESYHDALCSIYYRSSHMFADILTYF